MDYLNLWVITYVFLKDVDIEIPPHSNTDVIRFLLKEFCPDILQTTVVNMGEHFSREDVMGNALTRRTDVFVVDAEFFTGKARTD